MMRYLEQTNMFQTLKAQVKTIIVLLLSVLAVFFLKNHLGIFSTELLWLGAAVGLGHVVLVRLLGNLCLKFLPNSIAVKTLFGPKPNESVGLLMASIASFATILVVAEINTQSIQQLTQLVLYFLAGASFGMLLYDFLGYRYPFYDLTYQIDRDRYDTFIGAMAGTVFLATNFVHLPTQVAPFNGLGVVMLPLALALGSLVLTYLGAMLVEFFPSRKNTWLFAISILSAGGLIVGSAYLVPILLDGAWMVDGEELNLFNVFLAIQFGVVGGLLSGNTAKLYDLTARKYVDFMLKRNARSVFFNVSIRVLINSLLANLPLVITTLAIWFAFLSAGLYGLGLALLGMVSNVGVGLLIADNRLAPHKIQDISDTERKKLALVAPSLANFLFRNLKGMYRRTKIYNR